MKNPEHQSRYNLQERLGAAAMTAMLLLGPQGVDAVEPTRAQEEDTAVAALTIAERSEEDSRQQWNATQERALASLEHATRNSDTKRAEELKEAFESFHVDDISETLAVLSGIPAEEIERQGSIREVRFYAEDDWRALLDRQRRPSYVRAFVGTGGIINIDASFLVDQTLDLDTSQQFETIATHEVLHVLTESCDWLQLDSAEPSPVPYPLYEGVTELMTLRSFVERHGEVPRVYGYPGGATVGAYLLSKAVDEKRLFSAFLRQDLGELKNAVNDGVDYPNAFQVLTHARGPRLRHPETGAEVLAGRDPTMLLYLIKLLHHAGDPYREWLNAAPDIGITEHVEPLTPAYDYLDDNSAVDDEIPVGVTAMIPLGDRLHVQGVLESSPRSPVPFRLYFYTSKEPIGLSTSDHITELAQAVVRVHQQRPQAMISVPIDIMPGPFSRLAEQAEKYVSYNAQSRAQGGGAMELQERRARREVVHALKRRTMNIHNDLVKEIEQVIKSDE